MKLDDDDDDDEDEKKRVGEWEMREGAEERGDKESEEAASLAPIEPPMRSTSLRQINRPIPLV